MNLTTNTPVSKLPFVGPAYAARLAKLGVETVRDLLYHLPARFEDYSTVSPISAVQEGEIVTVRAKVAEIKNIFTRRGLVLQEALLQDQTGPIKAIWFNQRFLTSIIRKNDSLAISGRIKRSNGKLQMESPDYEIIFGDKPALHTGRLVPIYPETAGISSRWLRTRIHYLLEQVAAGGLEITDFLPQDQRSQHGLSDLRDALRQAHFPDSLDQAQKSRRRLAFDELLLSQLESRKRKQDWQSRTVGKAFKIKEFQSAYDSFEKSLPFTLTSGQKKVIAEILADLSKEAPMNRLLQGDVGSGKTVVAAFAILAAHLNGLRSVLMAPTEILARQHYNNLSLLFKSLGIRVGIATGSIKDYRQADIIVGTHALLTESFSVENLGLVVIDEQHRFGVSQRAKLAGGRHHPHVLTMTATPIPRTVALTLYGDLDLSILDEMPENRLPVKTWVVPGHKRNAAYQWIREQQTQAFIICPLIEESEAETLAEVKAAKAEYEFLSKKIFPDLKMGLLHGRLKPKEKDVVLNNFREGKLDILVATPVVEVGIDIPTATIMVVEAADRFGLAQLHQLRGRVGRGDRQSFCLLFTQSDSAVARLKHLESLNNGLKLAETDLSFRGPGQRFGLAQHGRWDLKIADFSDLDLVEQTSRLAQKVIANPGQFPALHKLISESKIQSVPN